MSPHTAERGSAGASTRAGTGAPPLPAASLALLTAWFAVITGLIETSILAVQQQLLDRIIYRSAHYLWMPSAGALIVFGITMLLLFVAGKVWPGLRGMRAVIAVLLWLTGFSVLMVPRWLHPAAAVVLALGVAIILSERLTRNSQRFNRIVRWSTAPLLLIAALLLAVSFASPRLRERSALAGLPQARAGSANIIFLILDTVRSKSLSLYGYARPTTPNLAALAKRGVVFDMAVAPAPWTLPTHASLFTGRSPGELTADRFTPLDDTYPTLAEKLAERGYASAGFVANLAYASYEFGLERGFHHWDDYQVGLEEILTNSSLGRALLLEGFSGGRNSWLMRVLGVDHWLGNTRTAANVNDKILSWLARHDGRPFFVFANYFDAHMPYLPPESQLGRFGPIVTAGFGVRLRTERPGKWHARGDVAEEAIQLDRYEEAIAYLDAEIGALIKELEAQKLMDNTILVISSDHGEEFGEHGFYEHDSSVFLTQTHVPLMIIAPGRVPGGMNVRQPVGLMDLPATLIQLSTGETGVLPGQPLVTTWSDPSASASPVTATLDKRRHSQAALVTPQYHYIRFKTGEERLFDHNVDRNDTNDLSATPAGAAALPALRAALREHVGDRIFQLPAAQKSK
ncbi:MAG TPA: sulfatase [Longimicrobiales bacterium]